EGADLAPGQRLLGDEQERLEGGLGQLDRRLGVGRPGVGGGRRGGGGRRVEIGRVRGVGRAGRRERLGGVRLVSGVGGHANDSRVSSIGASSRTSTPAAARSWTVVTRATIGPHGSACSTTISRRFISSRRARNVIAMTTRSRTPASRSWRTKGGGSR